MVILRVDSFIVMIGWVCLAHRAPRLYVKVTVSLFHYLGIFQDDHIISRYGTNQHFCAKLTYLLIKMPEDMICCLFTITLLIFKKINFEIFYVAY